MFVTSVVESPNQVKGPVHLGATATVASDSGVLTSLTTVFAFVLVALLPFHFGFALSGVDPDPVAGISFLVPDAIMMSVGFLGLIRIVAQRLRGVKLDLPLTALWGFWFIVTVSFALNPSARGLMQVARLGAVPVLVDLAIRQNQLHRFARILVGVTGFSALVTLIQRFTGGAVGLGVIGERGDPFLSLVPGYATPAGFTGHPYHAGIIHLAGLVTLLVMASRRIEPWQRAIPLVTLLALAAVQSSSRMLLLAVVSALAILLAMTIVKSRQRAIHAALFVAALIPLVGWFSTHAESFDRSGGDTQRKGQLVSTSDNGRSELFAQSINIWKSSPILGVGPGNYVRAQRELGLKQLGPWPIVVHSLPLQVLSETGLAGVAALAGTIGVLLASVRRRKLAALLALAPLAPVALLDHAIWSFGFGLAVLGLLIALALPPFQE